MNRPSLDTNHVPEGEKELSDAVAEAPSPGRLWFSRMLAWVLVAVAVYAVCRGAVEYPHTVDETQHLRSALGQADMSLTHLPASGERAAADWGDSVRTWRQKSAERYAVVRLHLYGAYGLMLLCPVALAFAVVVWWRGQFPGRAGRLALDKVQIAMGATALLALAGLRIFDASTLTVMGKTPPVPSLQAFVRTPTAEQKAKRLAETRATLEQALKQMQDKKSTAASRAMAARTVSQAVWDKPFVATLSNADKEAFRATLTELVKRTNTEEDTCPVLIRAIAALGDAEAANELELARERGRATWVDVKRPEAVRFLFHAVANGREADVKTLVERGVNVNAVLPAERHTALHEAVRRRQVKVAEFLLSKGAKLNIAGAISSDEIDKEFPLHRAVGEPRLVRLLLDKGANPDVLDFRGMTPLHVAAASGDAESAELLLAKKAKLNPIDFSKRTPLDVATEVAAKSKPHAVTKDLLVQKGAVTSAQLRPKNTAEASISPTAR